MKASEFERKFDRNAEHITGDLDLSTADRPLRPQRRVHVDFPVWMVASVDGEARPLGLTRPSIANVCTAERYRGAPPG